MRSWLQSDSLFYCFALTFDLHAEVYGPKYRAFYVFALQSTKNQLKSEYLSKGAGSQNIAHFISFTINRARSVARRRWPSVSRAPDFPYWVGPTCMVWPLAPSPDELLFMAAEISTTRRLRPFRSRITTFTSGLGRLVSRPWSVGGVLVRTTRLLATGWERAIPVGHICVALFCFG